jgi:hypothetical protein
MPVTAQLVAECVREVQQTSEQLVLVVGKPGSGKSKILRELAVMRGWEYLECRTLITDEILELVPKLRPQQAPAIMSKILEKLNADVILLDGTQVLFAPVLNLDPLRLLRQLSKKQMIVTAWPGEFDEGNLSFHPPGQEGKLSYLAGDSKIIALN